MDHGALREVCAKTGNFPKALQNGRKVLHILLDWSHKNHRIVRIERSPQNGPTATQLMKQTKTSCFLQNLRDGVDCEDKEEGDNGVPLS
jgi:hypothetical protein